MQQAAKTMNNKEHGIGRSWVAPMVQSDHGSSTVRERRDGIVELAQAQRVPLHRGRGRVRVGGDWLCMGPPEWCHKVCMPVVYGPPPVCCKGCRTTGLDIGSPSTAQHEG